MDQGAASYRRFLAGDETGLTELVAQFADGLILFVLPIAGDAAAAEDIAEETFARLCIRKPAYKDTASFKTWLYTIARNLALDRARKRARMTFADDETLAAVPDGTAADIRTVPPRSANLRIAAIEASERQCAEPTNSTLYFERCFSSSDICPITS